MSHEGEDTGRQGSLEASELVVAPSDRSSVEDDGEEAGGREEADEGREGEEDEQGVEEAAPKEKEELTPLTDEDAPPHGDGGQIEPLDSNVGTVGVDEEQQTSSEEQQEGGTLSKGTPSRPTSARPTSATDTSPDQPGPAPSTSRPSSILSAHNGEALPSSSQPATEKTPHPTRPPQAPTGIRTCIDVEVSQGPGGPLSLVKVDLDYTQLQAKPFLGGFRSKRNGVVYHHAFTQTPRQPKFLNVQRKVEHQTQTVKQAQRAAQTVREAATQMERPGIVIDTSKDRVLIPGRYQTSEERLAIVVAATCTIQRYWRGYRGRVRAGLLFANKVEREGFVREQEIKARQEAEEHRRKEIERRMHPRTAADFDILYSELEAWRLQETRKIKHAGLDKGREQEVLQQLLQKETKLLQTIDRLKINADHENKDVRIQTTLTNMGKPKKFELRDGKTVEVHTPFTTRAMELMQLYNGLNLPMLTIDERLDVLLHVKWTVKEFDCNLTREIVELIEREADLLNRGRNPRLLEGLRKRISSQFLTFIETPEFNPEAQRFKMKGQDDFETYMFSHLLG